MHFEFLLLGLIGSNYRGYYSGKGKSGGGKFIGGDMGDNATKYDDLRKSAKDGDADAQKQMQEMAKEAKQRDAAQGSTLSSEKIYSVVRNEENRIQKEKVEHAVLVTPDGKVQTWTDNKPSSVSVSQDKIPLMHGATFSHNHPNGMSLSSADWASTVQKNSRETRAIGSSGVEYSLKVKDWESRGGTTKPGSYDWGAYEKRTDQAYSIKKSRERIENKVVKDAEAKLEKAYATGTLTRGVNLESTLEKVNFYADHAINIKLGRTKLAKGLGLEYSAKFNAQQQKEWAEVKGYFGL